MKRLLFVGALLLVGGCALFRDPNDLRPVWLSAQEIRAAYGAYQARVTPAPKAGETAADVERLGVELGLALDALVAATDPEAPDVDEE